MGSREVIQEARRIVVIDRGHSDVDDASSAVKSCVRVCGMKREWMSVRLSIQVEIR
jgi:hypothetical protein